MKALILAAGLGTRLKPWTLKHPKALAPVNGKPLLQRTIDYLKEAGIEEVVVNVHHFSKQVVETLMAHKGWGMPFKISDESQLLMDTGGAVMQASQAGFFKGEKRLLVINADILTDMPLLKLIRKNIDTEAFATLAVSNRISSRKLLFDRCSGFLGGWENEKTGALKISRKMDSPLPLAFSGIHCIQTSLIEILMQMDPFNKKIPFSIIEAYLALSKDHDIDFFDHSGSKFMDTGTPERLDAAARLFD